MASNYGNIVLKIFKILLCKHTHNFSMWTALESASMSLENWARIAKRELMLSRLSSTFPIPVQDLHLVKTMTAFCRRETSCPLFFPTIPWGLRRWRQHSGTPRVPGAALNKGAHQPPPRPARFCVRAAARQPLHVHAENSGVWESWQNSSFLLPCMRFLQHFISNNQVNCIWRILTIPCLGPQFVEFLFLWLPTQSTFQNCHSKTMIKTSQLGVIPVTAHLTIFPLLSSPCTL